MCSILGSRRRNNRPILFRLRHTTKALSKSSFDFGGRLRIATGGGGRIGRGIQSWRRGRVAIRTGMGEVIAILAIADLLKQRAGMFHVARLSIGRTRLDGPSMNMQHRMVAGSPTALVNRAIPSVRIFAIQAGYGLRYLGR
jgi:hypothetical protein